MNKKILPILFFLIAVAASCINKVAIFDNFNGFTQGSTYSIVYDNSVNISPEDLKMRVEKILHDFDMSLSVYQDSSIISKINRNEDVDWIHSLLKYSKNRF